MSLKEARATPATSAHTHVRLIGPRRTVFMRGMLRICLQRCHRVCRRDLLIKLEIWRVSSALHTIQQTNGCVVEDPGVLCHIQLLSLLQDQVVQEHTHRKSPESSPRKRFSAITETRDNPVRMMDLGFWAKELDTLEGDPPYSRRTDLPGIQCRTGPFTGTAYCLTATGKDCQSHCFA